MTTQDRLVIFPSRTNLVLMTHRLAAARRGVNLLKRKRDGIDAKMRELRRKASERGEEMDESIREAIFSIAKADLKGTDLRPVIVMDCGAEPGLYLYQRQNKTVGVKLNYFEIHSTLQEAYPLTGLACGGEEVVGVRAAFYRALHDIVEFASLEFMIRALAIASRQTNMRVNALDYVVIPRYINTFLYIRSELEEFEREDFYRLKRSQAKQLEAKIAFTKLVKSKNMTTEEYSEFLKKGMHTHPVADITFDEKEFSTDPEELERLRRDRYSRHLKRARGRRTLPASEVLLQKAGSSFMFTPSMTNFIKEHKTEFAEEGDDDDDE